MAFELPNSMDECLYFTRRTLDNDGKITAWVEKKICPECKKVKMGKPLDKKTGRPKIRAKEYVCPGCGFQEEKQEHEDSCEAKIIYTCPHCKNEGEVVVPYKRKSFEGVKAIIFECQKCGKKIGITKKMAEGKKKPKKS